MKSGKFLKSNLNKLIWISLIVVLVLLFSVTLSTNFVSRIKNIEKDCGQDYNCFSTNFASCSPAKYQHMSFAPALISYELKGLDGSDCIMYNKIINASGDLMGKDETCRIPSENSTEIFDYLVFNWNCNKDRYTYCSGTLTDWRTTICGP